jgi:hypothetical protein
MGLSRHLSKYPGRLRSLFLVLSLLLGVVTNLEAQAKARRPSRYACPVTENLFPKQERSGDVLRYIFPDITKLALRMAIALISSDSKDLEIAFNWTDWRPHPGSLIARTDGSPNCYFLGPSAEYHENIVFVEISLTIPPGVEVKEVSFSSLRSEYVSRDCPMPKLGKEIREAYEESRQSPQDKAKTARFIALMEKAVPEYDCVYGSGYDPVPAWCLIDVDNLDTILDLIHYLYQKVEDAHESALRVFAGMFNKADGMISEVMADQIWKVMHDKPLFILKVWPDIRNYRRNIVLISVGLQDSAGIPGMIEIYRDIAIKEPIYKSACEEIISILSKKSNAD